MAEEVKAYIKRKYKKPGDVFLGIVHRLDRPVGGVIVFARTSKALTKNEQLVEEKKSPNLLGYCGGKTTKRRWALVNWLKKNQEKNRSRAYDIEDAKQESRVDL